MLKYSILLFVIFISGSLLTQTSDRKKKVFKDFYNMNNVYKAEATLFKEKNYELVDYKDLLEIIECSKSVVAKFIPKREVIFYQSLDETETTYKVYFSENNKFIMIDGKTFVLSKKESNKISKILNP